MPRPWRTRWPTRWRPRIGARRIDRALIGVVAIAAVALVMRLVDLGAQALHHDESLHATFSYYFSDGRGYRHDPLMHGPFQFHVIAGFFKLFGDGDAMARMPHAIAGSALVLTPLLLRRWLGGVGTVAVAAFLAFSPTLLYYSRFARNDIFVALWTLLLVVAVWRYLIEGRTRWLLLLAASLALAFSTKETVYLTAAMLLVYLEVVLVGDLLRQRGTRGAMWLFEGMLLLPSAWLIAALWGAAGSWRERLGFESRPRSADLIVVIGALTLPFLAAAIQLPFEGEVRLGGRLADHTITAWFLTLLAASVLVGLAWDWRRWLPIVGIAMVIVVPLFTTGFTNIDGFQSAFWGQLDYWLDQQDVQRGNQPGFYYFMMVPLYEFLSLIPALLAGLWLLWRGDRLVRLLAWWFLATFIALSFAGEKMPWLTVHLALPLAVLGGYAIGRVVPAFLGAVRHRHTAAWAWSGAGASVGLMVLLAALSVRGAVQVSYGHPDTPIEPLIYTQTSPDVPLLAGEIRAFVEDARGDAPIVVDTTSSVTWPWAWYLRDVPNVTYIDRDAILVGVAANAILISAASTVPPDDPLRQQFERSVPYHHRWWFPESGYRATSFESLWDGLRDGSLIDDWVSFFERRVPEEGLGALEGEVLFPAAQSTQRR